jgi:hypothetical protein
MLRNLKLLREFPEPRVLLETRSHLLLRTRLLTHRDLTHRDQLRDRENKLRH